MKPIFPILFFLLITVSSFSQVRQIDEFNTLMLRSWSANSGMMNYDEIKGTPYSSKELLPGSIFYVSGNHTDSIPMRYNWYTNQMEFENENKILIIPVTQEIDYIMLNDSKYVPFNYLKNINGYMLELCRGKYSLFRREEVKFFEAQPPQSGYDEYKPAHFEWSQPQYYLISHDGKVTELIQNKKKVATEFPDLETEVEKLIHDKKLNVKKENDLVELIQMINEL